MTFKDHFSKGSSDYARYRPSYPPALFAWLAAQPERAALAWDAGAGSGQAAVALAAHFERVIATDPSAAQVDRATPDPRVEYRVERAERSSLADASVDLVTVAQALHWFDHPAFFAEVARVLRPGGALAAWCYEVFETTPEIDAAVSDFYHRTVGPYWPPERRWIETGYADLELPFARVEAPTFEMALDWDLDALLGYLGTWSAVQRYREDQGRDPLPALRATLAGSWGDPGLARRVRWPLKLHVARRAR